MSAASAVPAVPIEITDSVFDPFNAPEGWFASPRRMLLLFKPAKDKNPRLMSLSQAALIVYLENETWGERRKNKPPELWTKAMGLLSIARACGVTVQAIQPVIADAVERGLIDRQKRKGEREYRYRLCPENWSSCKGYIPRGIEQSETEEPISEESTSCGKDNESPLATSRLKPGQARSIEIAGLDYKLRPRNRFEADVEVTITAVHNGLVEFDIQQPQEQPGELVPFPARAKPNEKTADPNGKTADPNGKPTISSNPARSAPPASRLASESGAAAVRDFLLARFTKLHATLDRQTVTRIWGAIERSGAHLDQYRELVRAREKRGMTAAAYIALAEQDLKAYVEQQIEVERKGLNAESAISDDWADIIQDLNREEATLGSPGRRKR